MDPSPNAPKPGPSRFGAKFARLRPMLGKSGGGQRLGGGAAPVRPAIESGNVGPGGSRPALVSLSWADQDIENRWGIFKGGRYTSVNKLFTFILAAAISTAFFAGMIFLHRWPEKTFPNTLAEFFVRDNNLPATIPATLFFFYGVVIVALKIPKLRLQRRALDLAAVP